MKPSKEDKDLDERIRSAIGTEEVIFDFDKWKASHQHQIERFKASVSQEAPVLRKPYLLQMIKQSRVTRITAAAAIIIAMCILFVHHEQAGDIKTQQITKTEKSPAELTTLASLSFAYHQGGMEMVEQMCDKALKMAGQRPANISMNEFVEEINNGKTERTEL